MLNGIQGKAGAVTHGTGDTMSAPNAQQGTGAVLNNQKDASESSTDAKFGDVWKNVQAKYGAKAEKPREIKKQLGKDDFLRIMVTQMKHQDPTSPFKAEQFAAELAQFTSVEQLQNLNTAVGKLGTQNQPLERMAMTNLIGKSVTIDRDRFPHTEGSNESLTYNLPRDAKDVKISVIAESGETVVEKDLGAAKQGANVFVWDGLKGGTVLPSKSGNYSIRVEARDEREQSITIDSKTDAKIIGVSFEGAEPVFLVGDPRHPDKITMRNIVRIDEGGLGGVAAPLVPGAQSLSAAVAQSAGAQALAGGVPPVAQEAAPAVQPQPAPRAPTLPEEKFFTFEKGKGSANIDAARVGPEAAAAIAKYQQQLQGGAQADSGERGFPNGLNDGADEVSTSQASARSAAPAQSARQGAANTASGAPSQNSHNGQGR